MEALKESLATQPDVDAAVADAGAPAILGRREESIVTAGRGMRMGAMQIRNATIRVMSVILTSRLTASGLIIVEARIVAVSIVRPPLFRGFPLSLRVTDRCPRNGGQIWMPSAANSRSNLRRASPKKAPIDRSWIEFAISYKLDPLHRFGHFPFTGSSETLNPMSDPGDSTSPPDGCTFAAEDWRILATHWYPVALSSEVGVGPHADEPEFQRIVCPTVDIRCFAGRQVESVHEYNLKIFEEDRLIVETQRPERLPLDLDQEGHTSADGSSIAYRRGLIRLGLGRFFSA